MSKTSITSGQRRPTEIGTPPKTLPEIMASYERVVIIQSLQLNGFSRQRTAVALGIRRNSLYRRIKLLKIKLSELPKSGKSSTKAAI
jgi:DNA-binding NtrC family response regulator